MQGATILLVPEIAHQMGLIPLVWLSVLHLRGKVCDRAWWLLAGAFFISWLADTASHWTGTPFVGMLYPIAQTILVLFVFQDRTEALWVIIAIGFVGMADLFWHGIDGPDILFRTAAWGMIVGVVYPLKQLGWLRASLLVTFAGGLLSWYWYANWPGWTSWGLYQTTRLAGILLFCWAASNPLPHFKIIRA